MLDPVETHTPVVNWKCKWHHTVVTTNLNSDFSIPFCQQSQGAFCILPYLEGTSLHCGLSGSHTPHQESPAELSPDAAFFVHQPKQRPFWGFS